MRIILHWMLVFFFVVEIMTVFLLLLHKMTALLWYSICNFLMITANVSGPLKLHLHSVYFIQVYSQFPLLLKPQSSFYAFLLSSDLPSFRKRSRGTGSSAKSELTCFLSLMCMVISALFDSITQEQSSSLTLYWHADQSTDACVCYKIPLSRWHEHRSNVSQCKKHLHCINLHCTLLCNNILCTAHVLQQVLISWCICALMWSQSDE